MVAEVTQKGSTFCLVSEAIIIFVVIISIIICILLPIIEAQGGYCAEIF